MTVEPVEREERRRSFVDETRDEMRDAIEFRRLEREFNAENGDGYQVNPVGGDPNQAIMIELIRAVSQGNSGGKAMSPEMMMLMKQNNDMRMDGNAQMMGMFNAMNQANQGWIQLLVADRDRGAMNTTESKIMDHALNQLFMKPETAEESVWSDLIRSGQLPDIGRGVMEGLGGIMGAMRPPTGAPSYAQQAATNPPEVSAAIPVVSPDIQVPESQALAPTFHEKCGVVMERLHSSLPADWQADGEVMQLLARVVEVAVQRSEDAYPMDIAAQMQNADREVLLVANLRTIGLGIDRIAKGELTVDLARSLLQSQPIWPMLAGEDYESLMGII
ncbi:MAG: hypothetical protein VYD62_02195, partial [Candidatus Thermoplasmatota archaeon]|nr:hypothetical protein [Candidatus Thermoplasmatota archaeon]